MIVAHNKQLSRITESTMNKKISISFLTLFLSLYLNSATLIKGDKDAPEGQTFSFSVNKNIFSSSGTFYEGANETITANQEFAISRLALGARAFAPLAPETITLNGTADSPNPLFGAKIIALGMLEKEVGLFIEDMPVIVGGNRQATVYLFEDISRPTNIVVEASQDVHDAQGDVSSGIVDLTTNGIGHVFAAAKPNTGEFGDLNSGIALLVRGTIDVPQGKSQTKFRIFSEVNTTTGSIIQPQSLLLDPTSPAIAINNSLSNIVKNEVAMHWDSSLERLFIGLKTTAGSGLNDGTRAVVACKFIENGAITLETLVPDSVFVTGDTSHIIGARGANQQVSIHALKTMYTSTALNYLIVVGNVGNPASTQQSVFALPLVNSGDAKGTIAQKEAQPLNVFKDSNIPRLIARTITEPATTTSEMPQSTDSAAQVGGGNLTAGPIVNIIVRDDTVFACVGENNSGVYSSQAIFDAAGKITSWTQWQRAAGTTDQIFGAALNAFEGNFILASGTTADTVNTIKRTLWSDGSPESLQPLTTILDTTFAPNNGGIQGMQTFLPNSPGLQNISVLVAGGIGNIAIAQTGTVNSDGIIIPTVGADFNQLQEFDNGTITTNVTAKTVIIFGGALDSVGPITALEFARNTNNGWLFAGGTNGLAVLTHADGSGWDATTELSNNLNGLENGMSFKIIGNYSFVKKLIHDGDFLFVITHNTIDRINLANSDFGTNTIDTTTIASIGTDGVASTGGFLDGIFSQACGIIATTDQLLRIGNDKDVRTITSETDAQWTIITIGENAGAPTALYTVTSTNRLQDITKNNGGFLYVLTADVGIDQSRVNRFAVQPLGNTDAMNSTTIQAFDDLFVKNIPSFLLSFGEFRSNFATDGALYFATRNKNVIISPIALITPSFPVPRVGVGNVGDRSVLVPINFQQGTEINYFSRSAASGSWIAAGNFDTQILE
jgi:hypothetical protein